MVKSEIQDNVYNMLPSVKTEKYVWENMYKHVLAQTQVLGDTHTNLATGRKTGYQGTGMGGRFRLGLFWYQLNLYHRNGLPAQ